MVPKFFPYLLVLGFLSISVSFGQTRYVADIYTDIQKRTFNYADTLNLDFYDSPSDKTSHKPLVILVHGGGFVASQRDGGEETTFSTTLAKKGYAVASISYRLTMKGKSFGCDCPTATKITTYIEAVEDLVKAIYYLTRYDNDFKVDPKRVILIGSSAGAETILNTIAMKDDYRFKHIRYPEATIIGAVSLSGAVLNRDYLTQENAVPTLFFHGKLDDKVPYETAAHHSCKPKDLGYLLLDGPFEIVNRLKELNVSYHLFTDPTGGHEWADIGYRFPKTITDFLYQNVLEKNPIHKEEAIAKPNIPKKK